MSFSGCTSMTLQTYMLTAIPSVAISFGFYLADLISYLELLLYRKGFNNDLAKLKFCDPHYRKLFVLTLELLSFLSHFLLLCTLSTVFVTQPNLTTPNFPLPLFQCLFMIFFLTLCSSFNDMLGCREHKA